MNATAGVRSPSVRWGITVVAASLAFLVCGIVVFAVTNPPHTDLVSLQWAGSASAARKVVGGHLGDFRTGLYWDFFLIVAYTAALALACHLGRRMFCTTATSRWSFVGLVTAFLAGALNVAQDVLLLFGLHSMHGTWVFRLAATMSFLKFSVLLASVPIAVAALSTAVVRLVTHPWTARRWEEATNQAPNTDPERPQYVPPPPVEWKRPRPGWRPFELDRSIDRSWWVAHTGDRASAHFDQDLSLPGAVANRGTGICVSGGGIRSATVTLGALQGLRAEQGLEEVGHLVSVSGGGYMAGGFQLALTGDDGDAAGGTTGADVFAPGSAEEDHLRRHSSYLSDGAGQWAVALGVIFRNLVGSLTIVGLAVATCGMAIGWFYRQVPIVKGGLGSLPIKPFAGGAAAPPYPGVPWPVTLGVAVIVGLAVLLYVAELMWTGIEGVRPAPLSRLAVATTWAAILVVVVGVALPAFVWVSSWVTYNVGFTSQPAVVAGSASVIVSFVGALSATLWRNKKRIKDTFTAGKKAVKDVLPNSMLQMLIIWIALLVLLLAVLLVSGWVATSGLDDSWWALAVLVPLAVLAAFLDQTSMSLHPFYRRRLASAFAVRREHSDGIAVAKPYDYEESTPLSKYAARRHGFPRVTFAASANLTGQDRTPPGRRSVSFALGADYVGGPQVGWVRSDVLETLAGKTVSHDLTVESAIAISGAAFASAMGAQTRFYELFLSLVNLRLGAWLPNPYFVALKAAHPRDWTVPGLPRLRRLNYFAREILGIHPSTSPMLLCTDGGHYDNLGLVELLRRRCSYIYCFDASGASRPLGDTLAGAMRLAHEELGVEIVFRDPNSLVVGGAQPLEPKGPLAGLNAKLSESAVATATISYPSPDGQPPEQGILIYAQADLTRDMPYELLEFTQPDPGFPNDGTADQWFDASRFDSYQQLGLFLGRRVANARADLVKLQVRPRHRRNGPRAPRVAARSSR